MTQLNPISIPRRLRYKYLNIPRRNIVDKYARAHNEPHKLDLHYLRPPYPLSLNSQRDKA